MGKPITEYHELVEQQKPVPLFTDQQSVASNVRKRKVAGTSRKAYEIVLPREGSLRRRVLRALEHFGQRGATVTEIYDYMMLSEENKGLVESDISGRPGELAKKKLTVCIGERKNKDGNDCQVWVSTVANT